MSAQTAGHGLMKITLIVWRQANAESPGRFETYQAKDITPHHSFLEMLDVVNEDLIKQGKDPIVFDHDCREGICGMCSAVVNGVPHGGEERTTLCQLHMRKFKDGDTIYLEPWRARAFPVIRDLMVDRSALDRLIQAAGWISVHTGGVPDANASPIPKPEAEYAMDAGRVHRLRRLRGRVPQRLGHAVRRRQGVAVRGAAAGPGGGTPAGRRHGPGDGRERLRELLEPLRVQAACPKDIDVKFITRLNREFYKALVLEKVGAIPST